MDFIGNLGLIWDASFFNFRTLLLLNVSSTSLLNLVHKWLMSMLKLAITFVIENKGNRDLKAQEFIISNNLEQSTALF